MRISVVSYTNSLPFVHGLRQSGFKENVDFFLDHPAACAQKLLYDEVDIGLIPVAEMTKLNDPRIVSEYCIGALRSSLSVLLLSPVPLHEISHVYLDQESRTSVLLLKILFRFHWKMQVSFYPLTSSPEKSKANLLIGDKTFVHQSKFPYQYDLSEAWNDMTGLPFVFACWVANKKMEEASLAAFNAALYYGVNHVEEMLENKKKAVGMQVDTKDYLTNNISFIFDNNKKKALQTFLDYVKKLNRSVP